MFPVTGLVFCGGGGRGAYQIGVWQALRERGLDKYTAAVSGASVGALNAALFACGNLPLAERVWTSLKRGDITDPAETAGRVINSVLKFLGSDDRTITIDPDRLSRGGIFSLEGLVNVIAENGVNDCVSGCGTPCFACCHNTEGNYPEYFDLSAYPAGKITQYLAASCALPAVFPAVDIDGTVYRDVGVSDNTRVKPLYDIGIRRFIVSYLGSGCPLVFPWCGVRRVVPVGRCFPREAREQRDSAGDAGFRRRERSSAHRARQARDPGTAF